MTDRDREIRRRYPATKPPEDGSVQYLDWLRGQKELHDAVLANMVDAVIVTDERGRVTFANRAAEGLLARGIEELQCMHILDCFRDENGDSASWMGRKILRLEAMKDARQLVCRPNGMLIPVLLTLFPLVIDDVLVRVIGIMRDQTDIERRNRELEDTNAKLAEACRKLEEIASTDEMTGLLNRRALLEKLGEYMAMARRHDEPLGIVYIDPNRFKPVNDTYGHKQGDRVIREVAHRFRRVLYDTDIVARYGGDEFVAILPKTDASVLHHPLLKIWRELCFSIDLRHPKTSRDNGVQVSVAIGGAVRVGSRLPTPEEFIEMAEQAMYLSKTRQSRFEMDTR